MGQVAMNGAAETLSQNEFPFPTDVSATVIDRKEAQHTQGTCNRTLWERGFSRHKGQREARRRGTEEKEGGRDRGDGEGEREREKGVVKEGGEEDEGKGEGRGR